MPGTACDGCHRRKERCLFDAIEGCCRQCKLGQRECTFERRGPRMGRPPATRKLPYGSCEIINFEPAEQPQRKTPDRPALIAPSHSTSLRGTNSGSGSPIYLPYAPSDSTTCLELSRCYPRLPYAPAAELATLMDAVKDFPMRLPPGRSKPVPEALSDPRLFHDFHDHFMIGHSFSEGFRRSVLAVFQSSEGMVSDAYTAVLALWDGHNHKIKYFGELDLSQGSHCLRQLQTPAVIHPGDAAAVIMLGQIMVVYHIITLGTSAHTILRRSLLLVKDWYPSLLNQPSLYPITITPIFIDTVECLVKREIPVIRAPRDDDCSIVDRSAGICVGLLHLQYEACKIGHLSKTSTMITCGDSCDSSTDEHAGTHSQALEDIRRQVSDWEPRPSTSFYTQFTQVEVSAIMMQARVYRLATLLVIHRLQFPLGVEDEPAARLAMAIAAELEWFVRWVPDVMRGISVGFPLLVTMLEIDHVSERVIHYVAPVTAEPTYIDQLGAFIQLVKAARDSGFRGLWFDIADDKLSIPVLA